MQVFGYTSARGAVSLIKLHGSCINEIPVSRDQVWIRADIRAGRSEEQTRDMINRITSRGTAAPGIDASFFWVYTCDIRIGLRRDGRRVLVAADGVHVGKDVLTRVPWSLKPRFRTQLFQPVSSLVTGNYP